MQLIIEKYDPEEIERVLSFLIRCGVPTNIADFGYENLNEIAHALGVGGESDHLVSHISHDHSAETIEKACLKAVKLAREVKEKI